MKKIRIEREYPLNARKPDIVWKLISTDHGLERWLADEVKEKDGVMELTWGQPWTDHHTLKAHVVEREKNNHIRLKWTEEEEPDTYWEMRIAQSELTGELCLAVTDYATKDEVEDLETLWDENMERLHRVSGV